MSAIPNPLSFVAMPRRDASSEQTQQVNVRLKKTTVAWMDAYSDANHLRPTWTQIIEAALADFRQKHAAEVAKPRPPK